MRLLTVVNLRSGGSDAGLYDFLRHVGAEGAELVVRFADGGRRVEDLVHDAADFDAVVAAGGDGTVSSVCYELRDSGVPVLVYPAGTANLLAANLGLPTDAVALARVLEDGVTSDFDLAEIEHEGPDGPVCTGFTIMAGAGYDAQIMQGAQPMKSSLGSAAYLMAAVSNLTPTAARFELTLDDERIETDGIAVLLVNFGRIQFDLPLTPNTDPRDGKLDVAVVRSKNVVGLLPAVAAAMLDMVGDHPDRSAGIDLYSARCVTVHATPELSMQTDGDVIDWPTPFSARVLPGAARLLIPADSPFAEGPKPA